MLVDFILTVF